MALVGGITSFACVSLKRYSVVGSGMRIVESMQVAMSPGIQAVEEPVVREPAPEEPAMEDGEYTSHSWCLETDLHDRAYTTTIQMGNGHPILVVSSAL